MPGCCPLLMWCACSLCVCLPHLSSPLLLSMSLTVQISSTSLTTTLTMMMTCRLLCALLVLALCFSPSVCAEENQQETITVKAVGKGGEPSPRDSDSALEDLGHSNSLSSGPDNEPATPAGGGRSSEGTLLQTDDKANTEKTDNTTGTPSGTSTTAQKADQNAEVSPQTTTTTTTQAPTTTTTTTPEAPSTTTTEAPTLSTTRAPSRLREIDGSLSSSAWVCAPLLLAASALAYTTVG
ncbi:mucin TcMUCII, putative [Trypanosoma cruzi marinkellei]|uniref:Mucin TcMUCII, putative n=1 Tax=Trypanosoma cruzi marinkellei TaxID=85056 RepID=K2N4C6_TRYCR|nr:mucin TcMUCII, putative [Trypanosoma cruzi marinkellei]